MSFKKGKSGNPNGRPKGSVSKVNKELRERIHQLIQVNFEQVQQDLNELDPKSRVQAMLKLLEFVLPKGIKVEAEVSSNMSVTEFLELNIDERKEFLEGISNKNLMS